MHGAWPCLVSICIDVDVRNARLEPAGKKGWVPLRMLQFVIAGLVLGGIYAIASAGLVITYTSSGILNFAFGAMAYFIARFYYFLHTQHDWAIRRRRPSSRS